MSSPQLENGYTAIAHELFEAFYSCKMLEYERVLVMHLWRKTYGWSKSEDWVSNSQFAEETGIPRPHVTRTLKQLREKMIIVTNGKKMSVNKHYNQWVVEWRKLPHQVTPIVTSSGNRVTSSGNKKLPHQVPTITSKAIIQKQYSGQGPQDEKFMSNENLIPEVIKLFETVDPKNKTYYGNKTQRAACQFLLDEYGLDEIRKRTDVLPKTNGMAFFPNITTPCQLRDKWVQLDGQIARHKQEFTKKANLVV
jgi:phage replication O-like protein O